VPTCGDKFEEYLRGIAEKWAWGNDHL
jgi:hypothetical protein